MVMTNVYLVRNESNNEMIIIDPADDAPSIARKIGEMGGEPKAILLTHGHFDHIGAAEELRNLYKIPVWCEKSETEVLADPRINLSASWAAGVVLKADRTFSDGDTLEIAGFAIKALHTPGHTEGSSCFYFPSEKALFSGDTLFCESYGRTDFPTSSGADMMRSVRRLLKEIPEDVRVYPGHDAFTDIAWERKYNPLAE